MDENGLRINPLKNIDAVSPAIGVILMVVIVVIIAAILAVFGFGIGGPAKAPMAKLDYVATVNNSFKSSLCMTNTGGDSLVLSELTLTVKKAGNNGEPPVLEILNPQQMANFSNNSLYLAPGMTLCGNIPNATDGDILTYKVTDVPTGQTISETSSPVIQGTYNPPGVYGWTSSGGSSSPATPIHPLIEVRPPNSTINTSGTLTLIAYDGTTGLSVTPDSWFSSNLSVGTINVTGFFTPVSTGNTTITAALSGYTSGSTTVTVTAQTLQTLILRPNGNTATLQLNGTMGVNNWVAVSDQDSNTSVETSSNSNQTDIYTMNNTTVALGTITSVTIYISGRADDTSTSGSVFTVLRIGGVNYYGTNNSLTSSYAIYSTSYTTKPDGTAWTWADINNLETGVQLQRTGGSGQVRCNEVYVVVNYTTP
jgi:FlaG/FlaF family flagellin (archaellin)